MSIFASGVHVLLLSPSLPLSLLVPRLILYLLSGTRHESSFEWKFSLTIALRTCRRYSKIDALYWEPDQFLSWYACRWVPVKIRVTLCGLHVLERDMREKSERETVFLMIRLNSGLSWIPSPPALLVVARSVYHNIFIVLL